MQKYMQSSAHGSRTMGVKRKLSHFYHTTVTDVQNKPGEQATGAAHLELPQNALSGYPVSTRLYSLGRC